MAPMREDEKLASSIHAPSPSSSRHMPMRLPVHPTIVFLAKTVDLLMNISLS